MHEQLHEALENLGFVDVGPGRFAWTGPAGGFRVRVETEAYDLESGQWSTLDQPKVQLTLPHQCDEWEITWPDSPRSASEQAKEFREGLERSIQMLGTVERLIETEGKGR